MKLPKSNSELPKKVGPFPIEALIDRGPFSHLYLSSNPKTGKPIVIKALSPALAEDEEAADRFLEEAKIIRLQDHPNIVKLLDSGKSEGELYIAMEAIEGIPLREALEEVPFTLKKRVELLLEIAYALCHLHTHGVIHRDLKPENILIDRNQHVKVIDFGISQLLTSFNQRKGKRFIGTPFYMSPEQQKDPYNLTYTSDIYSLGIIAYELIVGKVTQGKVILSLLPKGLQSLIAKTLMPAPKDRYQDVVDFIGDISSYFHSQVLLEDEKIYFSFYKDLEEWENFKSTLSLTDNRIEVKNFFGPLERDFFINSSSSEQGHTVIVAKIEGTFWKKALFYSHLSGKTWDENETPPKPFDFFSLKQTKSQISCRGTGGFFFYGKKNDLWEEVYFSLEQISYDGFSEWLLLPSWPGADSKKIITLLEDLSNGPYFLEKLLLRCRFMERLPKFHPLLAIRANGSLFQKN